ncbi:RNA-directed DNA polymerase from mobile element jockey [Eumeta japonica]|uniref:RNA-directed DNA polymerase from mobile element jockey n=1 Tax=Eumeta variegata TaxID=151549 RepID=A0A4C1V3Y6_EUMVA|nr:RNA-directed DNA polymerase from mobile element jockey [Eumeta japonica]
MVGPPIDDDYKIRDASSRQHIKAAAPKCPITDRSGVCRYNAKAQAQVIAEYLTEQFIPNPPATSPNLQEHYALLENCKEGPMTGWHINSRAETATQDSGAYKQSVQWNTVYSTLLSHVAKIFERVLLTKLRLFLTARQEQYGFRSRHSTTLHLIRVLHHLASKRNCKRYTVAVLLDMEKAFDRVWHDGLIHKLLDTSLPSALTRVVTNFLQRRGFCVAVDDVLFALRPIGRLPISRTIRIIYRRYTYSA